VAELFGVDVELLLTTWHQSGDADVFGSLAAYLGLNPRAKESFLWSYRLHRPAITLAESTIDTLNKLEQSCAGIAVLTDGRSITQRAKLAALGLSGVKAYISEEWGAADKPDARRFEEIMRRNPGCQFVYVADNPAKDFQAPNNLGWTTVGVGVGDGATRAGGQSGEQPDIWIREFSQLDALISPIDATERGVSSQL
jgi:putative hydrolase of the HAD superfamily